MATALDIIKRSMRLIHVLDPNEEPTDSEAQDMLEALNDLIDSWSIDRAYIYTIREDILSWPANQRSQTIGPSGDFVLPRPVQIVNSSFYTDSNSNDYLLNLLIERRSYTSIVDKGTTSTLPDHIYYEPSSPDGTLYIWPTPSETLSIHLHTWDQLTQPALITTEMVFPPGYKGAFVCSLAEEAAPEFGVATPPEVTKAGMKHRMRIKRLNRPSLITQIETGQLNHHGTYNIFQGY